MRHELLDVKEPVILFYGEKQHLDDEFTSLQEWVTQTGRQATIDMTAFTETNVIFYQFLRLLFNEIDEDDVPQDIISSWERAIRVADIYIKKKKRDEGEYSRDEITIDLWTEIFVKEGMSSFIEYLSSLPINETSPLWIFLRNFYETPSPLQIAIERYLVPEISQISSVKLYLFYESSTPPIWKTYNFDQYVYFQERINKKLIHFQNPYIAGRPIRHSRSSVFFGREEAGEFIKKHLANNNLVVIIGERRLGKTSFLMNLDKYISPEDYFFVFLDIQGFDVPPNAKSAPSILLWRIAYEIWYTLKSEIQEPRQKDFEKSPEKKFDNFIKEQVLPKLEKKKILFLFDEFERFNEWLDEKRVDQKFFEFLSDFRDKYKDKTDFIFAGTIRLKQLIDNNHFKFFENSRYYNFDFLSISKAKELIEQPVHQVIDYTPQAVTHILKLSGGHPYFTQILCLELVNHAKERSRSHLVQTDIDLAINEVLKRSEGHLYSLWQDLSKEEQAVLENIAKSIENIYDRCDMAVSEHVNSLIQKGFLILEDGQFSFRVGLIYEWIKKSMNLR